MEISKAKPKRSLLSLPSIVVALTVSVVFFAYAFYAYQLQRDQMIVEIMGQAEESAARLSEVVAPYIESYEIHEYEKLIQTEIQTANHSSLLAIVISDYRLGKITGEEAYITGRIRHAPDDKEYDPNDPIDQALIENSFANKSYPISSNDNELIGQITVYVSDQVLRENLNRLLVTTVLTTAFLLLVLTVLLLTLLERLLIRPLNALVQAMSERDDNGIPVSVIPDSEYKEISVLSTTVNDMLSVIGKAGDKVKREHAILENVINGTRAGTWYWHVQTGETVFNERWAEIIGYTLDELAPISIDTWMSLTHPDDLKVSGKLLEDYFAGHTGFYECEVRMKHKEGHWVWVLDRGKVAKWGASGEPLEMFGTHQDITHTKNNEEQLELVASVYKQVHEGILITDAQGKIVDVNDAFTRITGFARDEAIGQPPSILKSGRHNEDFYASLWRSLMGKGYWSGEIWNKRKNGNIYPELMTISAVKNASGGQIHYVALFSDITSIKDHENQLEKIAHYDTLTGLPNRLLFRDRLRVSMTQAKRHEQPLALLFLDLDGFKEVNDCYGHDIGDQLLVVLAGKMSKLLREEDTLARLGGDEFVIILPGIQDPACATPIVNRVLTTVSETIRVDKLDLQVSASIGVAMYPEHEDVDADQLIRQADQAMYHAKLSGKNCFHFFDPDQDRSLRGLNETIVRVGEAFTSNEFELYYQPKVNIRTNEIIGFEGLIRWNHPEEGVLAPGAFLPAIEGNILMVELGEWTINQGLQQLDDWSQKGIDLPISINIAAIHLQQKDFVSRLEEQLKKFPQVAPEKIQFEVLETSALDNVEQARSIIKQCEKLGIEFAIDDFGTGYSTLSYLKHLPAQTLKIDQSFVRNMNEEDDDRLILEAVIGLAKAFKKQVVAEGLEDIKNADLLLDMGCEIAQGYGIARPMPACDVPQWITRWKSKTSEAFCVD